MGGLMTKYGVPPTVQIQTAESSHSCREMYKELEIVSKMPTIRMKKKMLTKTNANLFELQKVKI